MNTTAWAHLPNAHHIDRVLAHAKTHPEKWGAAWVAARGATRDAARGATRDAAWRASWVAARDAAWGAARDAAWGAAQGAAWGSIAALIAWDDAGALFDIPVEEVQAMEMMGLHAPVLMLVACIAMEHNKTTQNT